MARNNLPIRVPQGAKLLALLDRMCDSLLVLDGSRHPAMRDVIAKVMRAQTITRVPLRSSTYLDRVTAWLGEHRDSLVASLTDAVLHQESELAIRLATRLLLLAPPGIDDTWLDRVTTIPARHAEDEHRFSETAVLYELAARCHIADGRLVHAELLQLDVQNALIKLADPDRRRSALMALAWRRVRLYWARDDLENTLRQLDVIAGHLDLDLDPRPESWLLHQITYGEVLYRKDEPHRAARLLTLALATYPAIPRTAVERIDAEITIGHALRRSEGAKAARKHWVRVHRTLKVELADETTSAENRSVRDRLAQRELHLRTLIARPDSGPIARREDFTILGPAGTPHTTSTQPPVAPQ